MQTPTITTTIGTTWLRRAIVALAIALIAGLTALGLASRSFTPAKPRASTSAQSSAARTRYEIFKLQQAERMEAAPSAAPIVPMARENYEAFKLSQIDQVDARGVSTSAQPAQTMPERFWDLKLRQVDQIEARTGTARVAAAPTAQDRFQEFKQRQLDQIEMRSGVRRRSRG